MDVKLDDEVSTEKKTEQSDMTVRGRVFDQTKPETFNQVLSERTIHFHREYI